jgi:hypothetical protein
VAHPVIESVEIGQEGGIVGDRAFWVFRSHLCVHFRTPFTRLVAFCEQ